VAPNAGDRHAEGFWARETRKALLFVALAPRGRPRAANQRASGTAGWRSRALPIPQETRPWGTLKPANGCISGTARTGRPVVGRQGWSRQRSVETGR